MPAAVVRVGAEAASTGARAPLKSFAVVDAVVAAQALVEKGVLVAGERRVGRAQRPSGVVCTPMGHDSKQRAVACASQGPLERGLGVMRASSKMRGISNLLPSFLPGPRTSTRAARAQRGL